MKRTALSSVLMAILIGGCTSREAASLPTQTPVPLGQLVAEAVQSTLAASERIPPSFPYSPAQLAVLLEPGSELEGKWTPSTVTDITRPIPGYACAGYYGSCWGEWAQNISYGTQLLLLLDEDQLGQVTFMYFEDLAAVENAYQLWNRKWSDWKENEIHPYQRDPIGEQWLSRARHSEFVEEDASHLKEPRDLEVLGVEIIFSRCHGFATLRIWFPTQTSWRDPDVLSPESEAEKEHFFDLAYAFMRSVDERIAPYACNP